MRSIWRPTLRKVHNQEPKESSTQRKKRSSKTKAKATIDRGPMKAQRPHPKPGAKKKKNTCKTIEGDKLNHKLAPFATLFTSIAPFGKY